MRKLLVGYLRGDGRWARGDRACRSSFDIFWDFGDSGGQEFYKTSEVLETSEVSDAKTFSRVLKRRWTMGKRR